MAYGQIDPARLHGDALTQWYLRSPLDIEEEKRQAASRVYDAFFSKPEDPQSDRGPEAAASRIDGLTIDFRIPACTEGLNMKFVVIGLVLAAVGASASQAQMTGMDCRRVGDRVSCEEDMISKSERINRENMERMRQRKAEKRA